MGEVRGEWAHPRTAPERWVTLDTARIIMV